MFLLQIIVYFNKNRLFSLQYLPLEFKPRTQKIFISNACRQAIGGIILVLVG